jgi:plastocyanin
VQRRTNPIHLAIAATVGLAALAGCGGDDEPDAEGADACATGSGETVVVEIPEFVFEPDPVEIARCDSVVWQNAHDQAHTSTADGEVAWSTGNIAPGERAEPVAFEATGSFAYRCALHPFMQGTVEVR